MPFLVLCGEVLSEVGFFLFLSFFWIVVFNHFFCLTAAPHSRHGLEEGRWYRERMKVVFLAVQRAEHHWLLAGLTWINHDGSVLPAETARWFFIAALVQMQKNSPSGPQKMRSKGRHLET